MTVILFILGQSSSHDLINLSLHKSILFVIAYLEIEEFIYDFGATQSISRAQKKQ